MKSKLLSLIAFNLLFSGSAYAVKAKRAPAQKAVDYEIPWNVKEGEIAEKCPKQIAEFESSVEEWLKKAQADQDKTNFDYFLSYEDTSRALEAWSSIVSLIFNLHTDKKIRDEAFQCQILIGNAADKVSARTDIYQVLKALKPRDKNEERLSYVILKGLEQSGALISDKKKHVEFLQIQEKLNNLSSEFGKNINDDKSFVAFTAEELDGVPENVVKRFQKLPDGKLKVEMKAGDYLDVITNANQEETRKSVYVAYRKKVGPHNIEVLKQVLALKQKTAELLGYKNWAALQTSDRMAKNPETVFKFYDDLKPRFFHMRDLNLARLKTFVAEQKQGDKDQALNPWDIDYYARLYKKKYGDFDLEKAREYFPRKKVVTEMLKFYQELLGVKFKEINNKNVWHPTVKTYEIIDGGKTIAYFYLDLEPREGKYSHQAAMNYRRGYKMDDGSYRRPISVMMGNLTPEKPGVPALLSLKEVVTLFHEFGHVMHGTLTKAMYSSLSGTGVYRDFVEAPSQMLENWVYTDELLNRITSHYKTGKKIPSEMIKKIKEEKNYNSGIFYARQLMLGTYDMNLHTKPKTDPLPYWREISKEYSTFDAIPEDVYPAQFGHLMGYSAGYYSYLWSIVFAQDMFSKFQEAGVLNKPLGLKYRHVILEQGNMKEPMDLLKEFLGREPNQEAFLKSIEEK